MEIRSVVNEVKNEYPKMEQVTKKQLSKNIPKKWMKIGLSSLIISMIMKNDVFAFSTVRTENGLIIGQIAGGYVEPGVPIYLKVCTITQIVSAVILVATLLGILIIKIKSKKQPEPKKAKRNLKILCIICIISIIALILSTLIKLY